MPRIKEPRFRIEIFDRTGFWEAKVYDLADHGPDMPYAVASSGHIDHVMDQAAHYVLVASDEWLPVPIAPRKELN